MNYPFKTICCIISSPCHLCNLEYDKVELRIGTKNNRNYSKRKSMIYRDLTVTVHARQTGNCSRLLFESGPCSRLESHGYEGNRFLNQELA